MKAATWRRTRTAKPRRVSDKKERRRLRLAKQMYGPAVAESVTKFLSRCGEKP